MSTTVAPHNKRSTVSTATKKLPKKRLGDHPTPLDAPVLCLVRTANATGSQLVATVHTTLETTLGDIRMKLTSIAANARSRVPLEATEQNVVQVAATSGKAAIPVNYSSQSDIDAVTTARLHAFDLTAPFRFVRCGGSRSISRESELKLRLVDCIPRIPSYGLSREPGWQLTPPSGTVVVAVKSNNINNSAPAGSPPSLSEAIVDLFVAQGEFDDEGHSEKVVLERLMLQQHGYGRSMTVKQLSSMIHKWNANTKDFIGRTPLHEYARDGNFAAVRYLLTLPFVRVEERDVQGNTALHLATLGKQMECAQALLEAGAQLLVQNISKQTPLHVAMYLRLDALVDLYCRRLKQQQTPLTDLCKYVDLNGYHPRSLFLALAPSLDAIVRDGNVDALRALSRHYLFGDSRSVLTSRRRYFNHETLLHVAARSGNNDMVQLLLDEVRWVPSFLSRHASTNSAPLRAAAGGAPADSQITADGSALLDGSKRSPLHVAAMRGFTNAVRRLLPWMPAMAAVPDISGCTPLMLALGRGHVECAQFLVENAADVGATLASRTGFTALHFAAAVGATDVALRLINKFGVAVDAHTSVAVVDKRRQMSGSSRPMTGDRNEILRFLRSVRVKYSRLLSRKTRHRPATKPSYERTPKTVQGPTPLWCAIYSHKRFHAAGTAALLISHGGGSTFLGEGYLASLLQRSTASKQWDIAAAVTKLMGASAPQEGGVLAHFCTHIKSFGEECVRWLVERRVGLDAPLAALVASSTAGDLRTFRFLLDNIPMLSTTVAERVLLESLRAKQADAAGEMIRRGAALTSVEETKSPLLLAARLGLEPVVRAAASLPAVSTFDLVAALVTLLKAAPLSVASGTWAAAAAAPAAQSSRRQAKGSMSSASSSLVLASWETMGVTLVRRIVLQDAHVHPVELIHLAGAKRLFAVVNELAAKLNALPSDARVALLKSAPSAPSRPVVTFTPPQAAKTAAQIAREAKRKRKPLYKAPQLIERFVSGGLATAGVLEHRKKYRDVFSYLAERGDAAAIDNLIVDVRLSPWRQGDLRGWNAVDYAFENKFYAAAVSLIASGCLPLRHHCATGSSKLGHLLGSCRVALARVRRTSDTGAAASLRSLLEALAEQGHTECLQDVLRQLCVVLRQPNLQAVPWLVDVVRSAVLSNQTATLSVLLREFFPSLSKSSEGDATRESLLLTAAVHRVQSEIVDLLLVHGAPVHIASKPSRVSIRILKTHHLAVGETTTALVAAAALQQVDLCRKLLVAGNSEGSAASLLDQALAAAISGVTDLRGEGAVAIVNTLLAAAPRSPSAVSHATIRRAAQRGLWLSVIAMCEHTLYEPLTLDSVSGVAGGTTEAATADSGSAATAAEGSILGEFMLHARIWNAQVDTFLPTVLQHAAACSSSSSTFSSVTEVDAQSGVECRESFGVRLINALVKLTPETHSTAATVLQIALRNGHVRTAAILAVLGHKCGDHIGGGGGGGWTTPSQSTPEKRLRDRNALSDCCRAARGDVNALLECAARQPRAETLCALLEAHDLVEQAVCSVSEAHHSSSSSKAVRPVPASVDFNRVLSAALSAKSWKCVDVILRRINRNNTAAAAATVLVATSATSSSDAALESHTVSLTAGTIAKALLAQRTEPSLRPLSRSVALVECLFDAVGTADSSLSRSTTTTAVGGGAVESRWIRLALPAALWGSGGILQEGPEASVLAALCHTQTSLRKSLRLERERLTFASVTPITLATALGDEASVRYLLDHGASASCQHSELRELISPNLRRRSRFCRVTATGETVWLRSPLALQSQRNTIDKFESPSCRVSPVIIAARRLAMFARHASSSPAVASRGTASRYTETSTAATTCTTIVDECESLLTVLIRRGGLTRDLVNPVAILVASAKRWTLLAAIVEEGVRLSHIHGGGDDRFFRAIGDNDHSSTSPVLRVHLGVYRHVLHAASRAAPRDLLLLLARHSVRADVESALDATSRTCVYHALLHPQLAALETLAALHVPCDAVCDTAKRRTPLMIAAKLGNAAAVAFLMKFGTVNAVDANGDTALHFAVRSGKQDVVELLLAAQADASAKNHKSLTPAMTAALCGFDHIALPLAQHFSRQGTFVTASTTLLHCAALGGCQRLVDYVLRTYDSIGIFQQDSSGVSPVYSAYAFGHGAILRLMLGELQHRTEAPSSEVDESILNCVSSMHRYGWFSSAMRLSGALSAETAKRSTFSSTTSWEFVAPNLTPLRQESSLLMWCTKNANAVGVRVLADLNVCDDVFAIHAAAKRGSLDVLQLLVALRMSDPNVRDASGFLPVDHAILRRHESCASFLVQNMRLSVDTVHTSLQHSGTSLLHLIAMTQMHRLLPPVLHKLLQSYARAGPCAAVVSDYNSRAAGSAATWPTNTTTGSDLFSADAPSAEAVLRSLVSLDNEERTPFELAVLFGSAATTLRIAQAIQQLAIVAQTEATLTLPSALFDMTPCFNPAVRAVLFDFFDVQEALLDPLFVEFRKGDRKSPFAAAVGKGGGGGRELPGGDASHRLFFGDVRLIGIQQLKRDAFCEPKLSSVFTMDRERQVLKQITQAMELPFRLKFRPEGLKGLGPADQVTVLQRLSTSSLLGKYAVLSQKRLPVGTVELELVTSRSDVHVDIQGTTVVESFAFSAKNGLSTTNIEALLDARDLPQVQNELRETAKRMKALVSQLRSGAESSSSHPLCKAVTLRIDWNGLHVFPAEEEDDHDDNNPNLRLRDNPQLLLETVRHVNRFVLPEVSSLLFDEVLAPLRCAGVKESELVATVGTSLANLRCLTLRCVSNPEALVLSTIQADAEQAVLQGGDLVLPFVPVSAHSSGSLFFTSPVGSHVLGGGGGGPATQRSYLATALSPLRRVILRDVAMLRVHQLRDKFLARVNELYQSHRGGEQRGVQQNYFKFKLETEAVEMEDLPVALLERLLDDTYWALVEMLRPIPRRTPSEGQSTSPAATLAPPLRWNQLTSKRLVAESLLRGVSSVVVLFSARRSHAVKRSGSRLMLCLTKDLGPCAAEIESAVRADTVELELERLKEQVPLTVNDMAQRLNTYLPSTSLLVDLPSLSELPGDDDVLAALSLLNYDRSALILQEIIRGVSIGWDAKIGSLIRRHIRQLSLTLQRSGSHATVTLTSNGNLVLHVPLQCVENADGRAARISSWALPSAQQIASLTLMQLASVHPDIRELLDLSKGYGCWCVATGVHTRSVVAGQVRSGFHIAVRNVLNLPPALPLDETFEFASNKKLTSLRVTRPSPKISDAARKESSRGHPSSSSVQVNFSAPTSGRAFFLSIRLHGAHIRNSPLRILIRPSQCAPRETVCLSAFNTMVVKKPATIRYQLCDAFGNHLQATPPDLVVEGPPPLANDDGVRVLSWASRIPGTFQVSVVVDRESSDKVIIPIRIQTGGESHALGLPVQIITEEKFEQIRSIRRGAVVPPSTTNAADVKKIRDRIGLFFRATIRESERAKRNRECRLVGGVAHRVFPNDRLAIKCAETKTPSSTKN